MSHDLNEKLTQIYAAKWKAENHPHYSDMLDKFLFHMSDAVHDIQQLADVLQKADTVDRANFGRLLHRFFLHALPHLVAAGQLYDYVPDIFPEQRGVHAFPNAANDGGEERGRE